MIRTYYLCLLFVFLCFFSLSCGENVCKNKDECPLGTHCNANQACVSDCFQDKDCSQGKTCTDQGTCIQSETRQQPTGPSNECTQNQQRPCFSGEKQHQGVGLCKAGEQTCTLQGLWSRCVGEVLPSKEVCDKQDNDCDGRVDEGLQHCGCLTNMDCPASKPQCRLGQCIKLCQSNKVCSLEERCHLGYCQPCDDRGNRTKQEVCNEFDDDCDGLVDENLKRTCGSDTGSCAKGTQTCSSGLWGPCIGETSPKVEECNGKDDDCDGKTDEELSSCTFQATTAKLSKAFPENAGHTNSITSLVFSPDGTTLVSSSYSRTVKFWNVANNKLKYTFYMQQASAKQLQMSADGKKLMGLDTKHNIHTWEPTTGKKISSLSFPTHKPSCFALHNDGKQLVSSGLDKRIRLWDLQTKSSVTLTHQGDASSICVVAFSPNGQKIAATSKNSIFIFETSTKKLLATLSIGTSNVKEIAFSPDSQTLVSFSGYKDYKTHIWDLTTFQLRHTIQQFKYSKQKFVFLKDKQTTKLLVHTSNSSKSEFVYLDNNTGKKTHGMKLPYKVDVYSIAASPDSQLLAIGSDVGAIRLWNRTNQTTQSTFDCQEKPSKMVKHPQNKEIVVVAGGNKKINFWNLKTGKLKKSFKNRFYRTDDLLIDSTGIVLAVYSYDHQRFDLLDVKTGKQITSVKIDVSSYSLPAAFHPTKSYIAYANDGFEESTIHLFDWKTRKEVKVLPYPKEGIQSIAFHPKKENTLVTLDEAGNLWSWNINTATVENKMRVSYSPENILLFSPDGSILVTAGGTTQTGIDLWNTKTNTRLKTLTTTNQGFLRFASFSSDGRLLSAASSNGKITIWDVSTGKKLRDLLTSSLSHFFSTWDNFLVSLSPHCQIQVWK